MKLFITWLVIQCIFARVMFGMCLQLWASLKVPADYIGYFIVPAMVVCVAEAITSGIVVSPLINSSAPRRSY